MVSFLGFVDYCIDNDLIHAEQKQFMTSDVINTAVEYVKFFLPMCKMEGFDLIGNEDDRYTILDHCHSAGAFIASKRNQKMSFEEIGKLLRTDDAKMLLMLDKKIKRDDVEALSTCIEAMLNDYIAAEKPKDINTAYVHCMVGSVILGAICFMK